MLKKHFSSVTKPRSQKSPNRPQLLVLTADLFYGRFHAQNDRYHFGGGPDPEQPTGTVVVTAKVSRLRLYGITWRRENLLEGERAASQTTMRVFFQVGWDFLRGAAEFTQSYKKNPTSAARERLRGLTCAGNRVSIIVARP